jgi:xylulokinase
VPVLGLDIGTGSLKALVLNENLQVLGSASRSYEPNFPQPGWAEQDPTLWLAALQPAIGEALANADVSATDIAALAVCGQLDGCIPTARDGSALGPALIWMDRRGEADIRHIDPDLVHSRCGLVRDATHMAGKIAWLSKHFARRSEVATWHQPVSFIVAALTGRAVMARSLASTTMLYDLTRRAWDAELVAAFGTTIDKLPILAEESEIAGRLTAIGADLTGLPVGLPVAVGTGDDFSNPLGCGVCQPGTVAVSLGTAETVAALAKSPILDADRLVETHAYPGGLYHLGNPGWLSGGAVRWASSLLGIASDPAFSTLAAEAPAGSDGVLFIPALTGAMAPKWIASARGSFLGLTASHTRAHMARAVLEGTSFAMRDVVDRLAALAITTDRLRLMGGGAKSRLWCEIRSAVSGLPAEILTNNDASALGAALLALVAAGKSPDIATAAAALPLDLARIEAPPDERYEAAYRRYRDAFAALEPTWRD